MDSKPGVPYDAPPPYPGGGEPGHPYQPLPPGFNPPPPAGGFAPPAGGYAPPAGGYAPPAGGYAPPAGGYAPPAGGYTAPPEAGQQLQSTPGQGPAVGYPAPGYPPGAPVSPGYTMPNYPQSGYPVASTAGYPPPGYPMSGSTITVTSQRSSMGAFPIVSRVGGQQTATNVTVVHVAPLAMGPHPMQMTCPQCRAQIVTGTKTEAGLLTYIICGLCIFFGCICGCCLIPFCVNECQDVDHICPNCKAPLGRYRRL